MLIKVLNTLGFLFFFNAAVDYLIRYAQHQSSGYCRCQQSFQTEMTFKENVMMRNRAALTYASCHRANRGQELQQFISARQQPINEHSLAL